MISESPSSVLAALRRPRFLLGSWPWRALGHLLGTPVIAAAVAAPVGLLCLPWLTALAVARDTGAYATSSVLVVVGALAVAAGLPWVAMPVADLERRRLRVLDARPLDRGPRRPVPGRGRLRAWYSAASTWCEVAYALLLVTTAAMVVLAVLVVAAVPLLFLASPLLVGNGEIALGVGAVSRIEEALWYALLGLVLLPAVPYLLALVAGAHGAVARALLDGRSEQRLHTELTEVTRSRARLVDAFEAERRRIERDLHDGAQQRLVGLTLKLGLARLDIPPESPVHRSVADAHSEAKELMGELRELVHGIHPRVLTDRGLVAALGELADRCPTPVTVTADLPGRPSAAVEATAYFVVSEALTNLARHSGATAGSVALRVHDGLLAVEVHDNGRGGADPGRGTGLTGLADRAAVLDGRMYLSSPVGGPTLLRLELPFPGGVR
ncbi:sensor domain-containing protein [Pseudonocardia sichuanensis]